MFSNADRQTDCYSYHIGLKVETLRKVIGKQTKIVIGLKTGVVANMMFCEPI